MSGQPFTVLCLASYEKGQPFLRQLKQQGCRVFLLTSLSLKDKAEWPLESIDKLFYMPDEEHVWNREHTVLSVAHLMRHHRIDRIVPLDEFDLELAASLRAHLMIPGMDESTTRGFRDKLTMRTRAQQKGLKVPAFTSALNHQAIAEYLEVVPGPWVLKPRFMAGAIGIQKIQSVPEMWNALAALGDKQSFYLIERYIPGEVFHVDSVVTGGAVKFAIASAYGRPPLDVSHGGGIFTTRTLRAAEGAAPALLEMNARVLPALGLEDGVAHTEFILADQNGELHFLESAARVGGAHISDLVEAATGLNLWAEWARIESGQEHTMPTVREDSAGLLVALAQQEWPDTSAFADPEVVWRMHEAHHVGLIVCSPSEQRVRELLERYSERVQRENLASLPPKDRPSH
jgi:hypothetical protein